MCMQQYVYLNGDACVGCGSKSPGSQSPQLLSPQQMSPQGHSLTPGTGTESCAHNKNTHRM